jgi:hypothetical protein
MSLPKAIRLFPLEGVIGIYDVTGEVRGSRRDAQL